MSSLRNRIKINAEEECGLNHKVDTYEFHQCCCTFDFPGQPRKSIEQFRIQHCLIADDLLKKSNFENYLYIALAAGVVFIALVIIICTYKWYSQIKSNPFSNCFNCCKKKQQTENDDHWTAVRVNSTDKSDGQPDSMSDEEQGQGSSNMCMKFCMSDPVQDCCEFFDCDIMWRKKNIYMIPIFGKKKVPGPLQRRPTRPAPPPPRAVVAPVMKYPEPVIGDDNDCDPVPEAPPSPEPVRSSQPKAQSKGMYVDPIAFLQKPFMKSKEKNDEPDPLYSRVKDFVLGKVRKSASLASLTGLGVSANPEGSHPQHSPTKSGKYSKTASLASLHDLGENELDKNYSTKRSQSLASLHMHDDHEDMYARNPGVQLSAPGCRMSMDMDDVPPAARKDEYIDLEEMSKRMAAKMESQNHSGPSHRPQQHVQPAQNNSATYTPNFIPASAYPPNYNQNASFSTFQQIPQTNGRLETLQGQNPNYCPPMPAAGGRPPVPARTSVGSPISSGTGTLGRAKPVIPPRPPHEMGRSSPKQRAPPPPNHHRASPSPSMRGLIKPSGPPPPPPCADVPIESSI